MTKKEVNKVAASPYRVAAISVFLTLLLAGSGAYFLGYLGPRDRHSPEPAAGTASGAGERKIAYWRAPMNPTEIYDKPGKSAMGMDLVPVYEDEVGSNAAGEETQRQIAYWRAPMNPTEIYDKPGKSAMGMDLVPVYEDELVGGVAVRIDPVIQQNMGIRTALVKKESLVFTIRTYGHITSDETLTAQINTKASGWIEKLYIDFTGKFVGQGEPLYEIYSPELLAAQEEYLVAYQNMKRLTGRDNQGLLASARRRLENFDIAPGEIDVIEKSGKVKKTLMVRSPFSGFVIQRQIEEGGYVKAGTMLFRIADLSRIWVEAHIYEYEFAWVSEGQEAEMTLPYLPGRVFSGRVSYVYPYLQPKTRDVVVRLEFENPDLDLKPDMYVDVRIKCSSGRQGLVIPSEAVLRSGERNVVFVTRPGNKFTPRDVTLGLPVDGGKIQILTGLAAGETVVTSGQFLLDSESKLKEAVQKMLEAKREKIGEVDAEEEDFFEDMEEEDDFFRDLEETDDFFEDMEDKR
jgi:Cu(I)/Ag(I) efflux system membrane fusion protein/cobalt-zinc-cadmium efflux system membrane fusion protein